MKVLFVLNPLLDDYLKSGSARVAINIGRQLIKRGHEVGFVANKILSDIIPESKVYCPEDLNERKYIVQTIEYSLEKFYEEKYDVIHVHIHQFSVMKAIERIIPKDVPVVYTQHSKGFVSRLTFSYKPYAAELSCDTSRKSRIILPSQSMVNIWKKFIEKENEQCDNVVMIRNGIDKIDEPESVEKKYDLITCGGIDYNKGLLLALDFVNEYSINSLIVGTKREGFINENDEMQDYYNSFMKSLELKDENVEYSSFIPNLELRNRMYESKFYFSASLVESFSLVTAEAMSCGIPVLYIGEDSISELVDDKTGIMIPRSEILRKRQNRKVEIAKKYYDLMMDKIKNNEFDKDYIIKRFYDLELDNDSFINNHIKLYNELLK